MIRKRITGRRTVRAGDLKPHPLNWRTHGDEQKAAVTALYDEVGEVRSVLAYVADDDKPLGTDAPLTLIDGHGRREWLPDEMLEVEVIDVSDDEARKLLLTLDPTAALAGRDEATLQTLRDITEADSAALAALWDSLAAGDAEVSESLRGESPDADDDEPPQWLVLVTCKNEKHQAALLTQFNKQGLKCKALTS